MDTKTVQRHLDAEERRWQKVRAALLGTHVTDEDESTWIGELDRAGQHPADLASETMEREIDFGLLEEADLMIVEIDEARARLASGTYGRCQTCNAEIPTARLNAVPATRFCVAHERALEPRWATGAVGRPAGEATATAARRRMRA